MKSFRAMVFSAATCGLAICSIYAADAAKNLGACPVSGKPAVAEQAVDYKGAKVHLCCPGCPGAFKGEAAKFAAKANHQLVLSGQFQQTKCPLSGGDVKDGTEVDVSGVKVKFCCNNCQGKVAGAKGGDQVDQVFKDAAFDKSFALAK